MSIECQSQVAVVTGGSRGIGRAICIKFAKMGLDVVINYAGNEDAARETAKQCEAYGAKTMIINFDVADYKKCKEALEEIQKTFGSIDILVNNAGITRDQLMLAMSEEDFDNVINTNLKGTFNCMKITSKMMIKQRFGRIINLSSVVGLRGNAGQINYAASKAGVLGMTKSAAKELASRNITVNAVAPGWIQTDMTEVLPEKIKETMLNGIPIRRIGKPEDVANAVAFFASTESEYITGQVLCVDGGMAV